MTTTAFKLNYLTNVGFCADFGGRGFMMPTAMPSEATAEYS